MKKKVLKLAGAVTQALPDNRLIKLSEKQIEGLKTVSQVALALIATAGVISIAAVAPNALQALNLFLPKRNQFRKWSREEKMQKVKDAFYYLKRSNLVKFKQSKGEWFMSLTDLGNKRAQKLNIASVLVEKPAEWDSKWWLVAADIPTKDYRRGADLLRRKLKDMSFYPLQRTLWLYPFDPRKEIEFISQTFNIGHFVTVMKIEELDVQDQALIKEYFKKLNIL